MSIGSRSSWTTVFAILVTTVCPAVGADAVNAETLPGEGVWISPRFDGFPRNIQKFRATVWFEEQLLADG